MAAKKAKVQIRLVKGHCTIKPSVIVVPAGGTVEISKTIPGTAHVQVSGIGRTFKIRKTVKKFRFTIGRRTPVGIYPYAVFCYERKAFCTGSSMPIIIVPR